MPIPTLWLLIGYMGANTLTRELSEARIRGSDGGKRDDVVALLVRIEATYCQREGRYRYKQYCHNLDQSEGNPDFFIRTQ